MIYVDATCVDQAMKVSLALMVRRVSDRSIEAPDVWLRCGEWWLAGWCCAHLPRKALPGYHSVPKSVSYL